MPTNTTSSRASSPLAAGLLGLAILSLGAPAAAEEDALPDSDIVSVRMVSSAPEALAPLVSDLTRLEGLWPEGCTRKWVHGAVSQGPGASAELVYTMGPMRRKLAVTVSQVKGDTMVELDHAGNKGFITRFNFSPGELGTTAEMHTWIQAPPKPFQKLYFNKVQPKWRTCQEGLLENLALMANEAS